MEGMPSPSLSPRRLAPSVREGAKSGHDLDRNGTESGHSRTETASLRQIQQGIPTGLEGAKTRTRADFRAFAPGWAPSLSVSPPGFSGNRGGQGDAGVFRGRCPGKGTSGGFGGSSFLSRLEKPGTTRVLGSKRRETPIGRSFYTRDHLGSIRELTDSTQKVRARYDYDPYGRMTKISGDKDSFLGFTGHPWHAPSGLNLTVTRAYDPNLGRWLSRDPLGEQGGINLYSYVDNQPIDWRDPYGLSPATTWNAVAGGGATVGEGAGAVFLNGALGVLSLALTLSDAPPGAGNRPFNRWPTKEKPYEPQTKPVSDPKWPIPPIPPNGDCKAVGLYCAAWCRYLWLGRMARYDQSMPVFQCERDCKKDFGCCP